MDLGGWLRTEMVYQPVEGHPSQYSPRPALNSLVDWGQHTNIKPMHKP